MPRTKQFARFGGFAIGRVDDTRQLKTIAKKKRKPKKTYTVEVRIGEMIEQIVTDTLEGDEFQAKVNMTIEAMRKREEAGPDDPTVELEEVEKDV